MSMHRVIARPAGIALVEEAVPTPRADEVQVQTVVVGICGSDLHAVAGHHPFVPLPYQPGHEVVGIVRRVGADVADISVGDRITVEPTLPCWECKMCLTGRSNVCERLRFFGCGYEQGGMAEFFTIPANRIHLVPDALTDLQAALIEPLATPVHAVRLSGDVHGQAVAIIGAGTIGLLTLAAARHAGARTVVMTDLLASKRERARRLGADAVFDGARPDLVAAMRAELGESADVVFDCVAVQSTIDQAVPLATKAGTVVVVGVPAKPVTIPLPEIQDLQVRIQGSATYLPQDYDTAMDIIAAGLVRPEDLITAEYRLDRVAEAFQAARSGDEVKVVLTGSVRGEAPVGTR
ncbi:MAG: zinc-binding dehydrogenase [Propioniciclava sp.]